MSVEKNDLIASARRVVGEGAYKHVIESMRERIIRDLMSGMMEPDELYRVNALAFAIGWLHGDMERLANKEID